MPFYQYLCKTCDTQFKTYHAACERAESCPRCEGKDITKSLSQVTIAAPSEKSSTAGSRVEKFIEESRQTLHEQLAEARKDYNP